MFATLAFALGVPSIGNGFVIDDYFHRAALLTPEALPELARSPLELFAWIGAERTMGSGFVPWWASPDLRLALFRPLVGLTHALDASAWPNEPRLMHVHSLVWFAATVFAAACLYRRLPPQGALTSAGLAGLFFAIDDTHSVPASWIANRNAMIPAFFVVLTLVCYDRYRRDGWLPGRWLTPVCLALGVLSGESAVGGGAYLLAYALFVDQGDLRRRLLGIAPSAGVGVAWALAYKALGYGASNSALYIDPASQPLRFLEAAFDRAPRLLMGQFLFPPSDFSALASEDLGRVIWFVSVVAVALLAALLWPLLRRDGVARFWALGTMLSVLPGCSSLLGDRLLVVPGLGGTTLVATLITSAFSGGAVTRLWRLVARPVAVVLLFVHLVLAPLLFLAFTQSLRQMGSRSVRVAETFPDDASISRQTAIVTHVPTVAFTGVTEVYKALEGKPIPADFLVLASSIYPVEIERSDERTLVLRPDGGFLLRPGMRPRGSPSVPFLPARIFHTFEWFFRDEDEPFPREPVVRGDVTITIVEQTDDGRPAAVAFTFGRPVDDPRWRWLSWREESFVPFEPPPVGESVRLPSLVE